MSVRPQNDNAYQTADIVGMPMVFLFLTLTLVSTPLNGENNKVTSL